LIETDRSKLVSKCVHTCHWVIVQTVAATLERSTRLRHCGNVSIGGLGGVLAGRMRTAKSYLWLIQFKTKLR